MCRVISPGQADNRWNWKRNEKRRVRCCRFCWPRAARKTKQTKLHLLLEFFIHILRFLLNTAVNDVWIQTFETRAPNNRENIKQWRRRKKKHIKSKRQTQNLFFFLLFFFIICGQTQQNPQKRLLLLLSSTGGSKEWTPEDGRTDGRQATANIVLPSLMWHTLHTCWPPRCLHRVGSSFSPPFLLISCFPAGSHTAMLTAHASSPWLDGWGWRERRRRMCKIYISCEVKPRLQ